MPAPNRFPVLRGPDAQQSRVQDGIQQTLAPIATALQKTPIMGAAQPAMLRPALTTDWAPSAVGAENIGVYINALQEVVVVGSALTVAGVITGTIVFTLPLDMRPPKLRLFPVVVLGAANNIGAVNVQPNGIVTITPAVPAGGSIYLEFRFRKET